MKIVFPYIQQKDLEYAKECLELCKQDNAEEYGFRYPYFAPGGLYGKQWWQLDFSLALRGYQWIDRAFVETALWNFVETQKSDGRICLWGADLLPKNVAGGDCLQQTENLSSLPKLFDCAYHILQGTSDLTLKNATYNMLKNYLDWWFLNRQDKNTGLITAVFEETFIPYLGNKGEYAPVDINVEIYVGCHYTELIARDLGENNVAEELHIKKNQLKNSINKYLWNEEKGAYYPYFIKENKFGECLMASTFFPLRLEIAPKERREKVLNLLTDNAHFNWDTIPLTSVSKLDRNFTTTRGDYQGNASWSGNVWTLINEMVVRGLLDCNEKGLAAELAMKTLRAFNHNYTEFVNPFDGSGHGVLQYAWTATQYLELLIETIFGISYNAQESTIVLSPNLTEELKNSYLELKNIQIANEIFLDVIINHGNISCAVSTDKLRVKILNARE